MRARATALAALPALLTFAAVRARAAYSDGQPAVAAVGQTNLTNSGINGTPGIGASGYAFPGGVWSDGTALIVADTNNNRVLIYNSVPAANGTPADVVLGQPDSVSNVANQGGTVPAANTLSAPTGVYFDGATLYVADTGNHRVLLYYGLPNADDTPADMVVGQAFFSSGTANQGGSVGANTLNGPQGVFSDGASLYVSDTGNNRVLIYTPVPSSPNALAGLAVGQSTTTAGKSNQGTTPQAYTLSGPAGLRARGGNLYVSDRGNNRVLIYSPIPAVSGSSATVAVGQVLLTSGTANRGGAIGAATLSSPAGLETDAAGSRLIVADAGNNRVLIYSSTPAVNGSSASVVVGQSVMTAGLANRGGGVAANTLSGAGGVSFDGSLLYVSDRGNNRVLIYNPLPSANGVSANVVAGQLNMTTGSSNLASSAPGAATLFRPNGAWTDRTRLYVADRFNNRVLIYDAAPGANGASADVVVGQLNMSTGSANQGAAVSTNTLASPAGVFGDGARLFVADTNNSRALIYNAIPAANGAGASLVLGQAGFLTGRSNRGGAVSAQTLSFPTGVDYDGTQLYVADRANNRVLIWSSLPGVNGAAANVAVGQASLSSGTANRGGAVSASSLSSPTGVFSDGTRLFVADQLNNRVLIWNAIPAANGAAANVVVGQTNMTSNAANQGLSAPTAATLRSPSAVASDGTSLYVADSGNNRVLVYTPIPAANGASATTVIGQSSFTTMSVNQGLSVGPATLASPASVSVDSTTGRLYVGDSNSNRALLFLPSVLAPIGAGGATVVLNSPVSPTVVQALVPPGAVAAGVNMTLGVTTNLPCAGSPAQTLQATGIGFQVALDQQVQPGLPVTLTATYRPADLAGRDPSKLVLARCDAASSSWVPLPSISDAANDRVVAQTDHFSTFQLVQIDPAGNDLSTVRVFPNPFQPTAGQIAMTFASLPPGARVRVYAVTGVLVKDLSADATGIARWDGTNQAGANVASGIYYAYVQGVGRRRVFTVAIQR